ncbi:DUF429 domain-containing protein [Salinigranum marinum]|uniref:DUF429 domain-containing protein n=1 Tax=Salinigranum marinum TaxID=1515595 RepID=UPI002989BF50|nr:DUF429 domain-containing protein [Salinigranum marinum]
MAGSLGFHHGCDPGTIYVAEIIHRADMTYIGVDWGSNGWICAVLDHDERGSRETYSWRFVRRPSILSVWMEFGAGHEDDVGRILVDIPIGLPTDDARAADLEARTFLPPSRQSSVFPAPCEQAVYEDEYDEAAETHEDVLGRGLSPYSWSLSPRIREVDEFLGQYTDARGPMLESHPEVCFHALDVDDDLEDSKQDDSGLEQRHELLTDCERTAGLSSNATAAYTDLVKRIERLSPFARRIGLGNRDDVLDAMAMALTARLADGDFDCLPDKDAPNGVNEIVYFDGERLDPM